MWPWQRQLSLDMTNDHHIKPVQLALAAPRLGFSLVFQENLTCDLQKELERILIFEDRASSDLGSRKRFKTVVQTCHLCGDLVRHHAVLMQLI